MLYASLKYLDISAEDISEQTAVISNSGHKILSYKDKDKDHMINYRFSTNSSIKKLEEIYIMFIKKYVPWNEPSLY